MSSASQRLSCRQFISLPSSKRTRALSRTLIPKFKLYRSNWTSLKRGTDLQTSKRLNSTPATGVDHVAVEGTEAAGVAVAGLPLHLVVPDLANHPSYWNTRRCHPSGLWTTLCSSIPRSTRPDTSVNTEDLEPGGYGRVCKGTSRQIVNMDM